jgi:hypothetical protein
MNAEQEFLAHLDREIAKYEESAKGWQMLKDNGNYPKFSDAQIKKCRDYAQELRALKNQVIKEA